MTKKKMPWEEHKDIWNTKSKFFTWLRGGIRRSLWNKSPIKLTFIKNNRKRIPNPNPRGKVATVWGATCNVCKNDYPTANMQVDHIVGNNQLTDISDIETFILSIACVSHNDLQFICKECHKIKTHSEKSGLSFIEAKIEKQAIEIQKKKGYDKKWLELKGISPASNAKGRRQQIIEYLRGEENGKNS